MVLDFHSSKKCVKDGATKMCSFFCGELMKRVKVKWSDVCLPKSEGGLGVKELEQWNKASVLRNLWQLFINIGSLWVAWVNLYLLRCRSIWTIKPQSNNSWDWKSC